MNFHFLFFCSIFKIFLTIASSKKNLMKEKIDCKKETGDKVLNDEVELVDEEEDGEEMKTTLKETRTRMMKKVKR